MKAIIESAKKLKSMIPVCDKTILCKDGVSLTTNLEVTIATEGMWKDEGIYDLLGRKAYELEEYPEMGSTLENHTDIGTISLKQLKRLLPFTARDEQRPVMECVHLNSNHAVATDAHRAAFEPIEGRVSKSMLIPYVVGRFLPIFKGDLSLTSNEKYVCLTDGNVRMYVRLVEGTYPSYESCIPDSNSYTSYVTLPVPEIRAAMKEVKAATNSNVTNLVVEPGRKVCRLIDKDYDIDIELPIQTGGGTVRPNRLLMPVMMNKVVEGVEGFALDASLLSDMVTIFYDDPARALLSHVGIAKEVKREAKKEVKNPMPEAKDPKKAIYVVRYSERAVAIFGDTKEHKEALKAMHAKFNPFLKHKEGKQPGWVASAKRKDQIEAYINSL